MNIVVSFLSVFYDNFLTLGLRLHRHQWSSIVQAWISVSEWWFKPYICIYI